MESGKCQSNQPAARPPERQLGERAARQLAEMGFVFDVREYRWNETLAALECLR